MVPKKSQVMIPKIGLIIAQILIIVFLLGNIYIFINQDSSIAKILTAISFSIFLVLLIVSFITLYKLNKNANYS